MARQTSPKFPGSVPFLVKEKVMDFPPIPAPQRSTLSFPSSQVCWLSHDHRCLPSGDSTQMMPQPTFIENGTDPNGMKLGRTQAVWPGISRLLGATKPLLYV
jgi:hypothetical protein